MQNFHAQSMSLYC